MHGVPGDVVCTGRFYDFVEKRLGRWGVVLRQPIYEKDRIDPIDPAATLELDQPEAVGLLSMQASCRPPTAVRGQDQSFRNVSWRRTRRAAISPRVARLAADLPLPSSRTSLGKPFHGQRSGRWQVSAAHGRSSRA